MEQRSRAGAKSRRARQRDRRTADGRRRREDILDAAQRLFAARGFDATSTARVAAEAGVPNGLVFYYFASKMELLLTLVRERARVEQLLPEPGDLVPGDVAASVIRLGGRILEHLESRQEVTAIIFMEVGRHVEVRERAVELRRETVVRIASALQEVAKGQVTEIPLAHGEEMPEQHFLAAAHLLVPALLLSSVLHQPLGEAFDLEVAAVVLARSLTAADA
jgi:AcrR family transcriptional regulator